MRILSNASRRFQITKNNYIPTTGYSDITGTVVAQCLMELLHVHLLQAQDANAFQKCNIQYGYIKWHQGGFKSPQNVIIEEWGFDILCVQPAHLVKIAGATILHYKLLPQVQAILSKSELFFCNPSKDVKAVPNHSHMLHSYNRGLRYC